MQDAEFIELITVNAFKFLKVLRVSIAESLELRDSFTYFLEKNL